MYSVHTSEYEKYILSRDDWEFAGLYYDEGITGTKKEKRPELMRLMADCAARNIEIKTAELIQFDFPVPQSFEG